MAIDRIMNKVVGVLSLSIVLMKAPNCQLLSHLTCSGIWSASLPNHQWAAANQRFLFLFISSLTAGHVPYHTTNSHMVQVT